MHMWHDQIAQLKSDIWDWFGKHDKHIKVCAALGM